MHQLALSWLAFTFLSAMRISGEGNSSENFAAPLQLRCYALLPLSFRNLSVRLLPSSAQGASNEYRLIRPPCLCSSQLQVAPARSHFEVGDCRVADRIGEPLRERYLLPDEFAAARRYRRPGPFEDAGRDYRRAHKRMAVLGPRGSHRVI